MVAIGREGVIAYNVTLGAYHTYKFLETKVIPSLDRQRFILMDNVPFHKSSDYENLLKMLDTSNFVCNRIVHFSMLQNGYLDTSEDMSIGMISKIIKHY